MIDPSMLPNFDTPLPPNRECNICPSWTLNCIHYDDIWIALHKLPPAFATYVICYGKGVPIADPSHEGSHLDHIGYDTYPTYEWALKEFNSIDIVSLKENRIDKIGSGTLPLTQ